MSSIFLSRGIHSFIPPTLSTYYEPDNLLDAENSVFTNSVVQVLRCAPGTEELGRMMYFLQMLLPGAQGTPFPIPMRWGQAQKGAYPSPCPPVGSSSYFTILAFTHASNGSQ